MRLLSVKLVGSESLPGARACNLVLWMVLVLQMVLRLEFCPRAQVGSCN